MIKSEQVHITGINHFEEELEDLKKVISYFVK